MKVYSLEFTSMDNFAHEFPLKKLHTLNLRLTINKLKICKIKNQKSLIFVTCNQIESEHVYGSIKKKQILQQP